MEFTERMWYVDSYSILALSHDAWLPLTWFWSDCCESSKQLKLYFLHLGNQWMQALNPRLFICADALRDTLIDVPLRKNSYYDKLQGFAWLPKAQGVHLKSLLSNSFFSPSSIFRIQVRSLWSSQSWLPMRFNSDISSYPAEVRDKITSLQSHLGHLPKEI